MATIVCRLGHIAEWLFHQVARVTRKIEAYRGIAEKWVRVAMELDSQTELSCRRGRTNAQTTSNFRRPRFSALSCVPLGLL